MTTNNVVVVEGRSKALKEMAVQVRPIPVEGLVEGIAMITPKAIHRLKLAGGVSGAGRVSVPGPRFLASRAEINFGITSKNDGVKALVPGVRLFDAGIIFPDTGTSSDNFEIVEIDFGTTFYKTSVEQKSGERTEDFMEKQDLIMTALGCDRYWFAIPSNVYPDVSFWKQDQSTNGNNHGLLKVILTNRGYARSFARINHPEKSKWFDTKHRKMSVAGYMIFALSVLLMFLLLPTLGEKYSTWVFLIFLILLGIGSYFVAKGTILGEPI